MNVIKSELNAKTAELAYAYYLERVQNGMHGDAGDDWMRAEKETLAEIPPLDTPSVTIIKGIGPKVAAELSQRGIETVSDLAKWSLADFGEQLPRLTARAKSGRWLEQAIELGSIN